MPLNQANPAWVDAVPDLGRHIVEIKLPPSARLGDGHAALVAVASWQPDLVVLDGNNPFIGTASGDQILGRYDAVEQAPAFRRGGIEEIAGQRQLAGAIRPDQARKFLAESPARHDADTGMGIGKAGVFRRDQDIAGQRDF